VHGVVFDIFGLGLAPLRKSATNQPTGKFSLNPSGKSPLKIRAVSPDDADLLLILPRLIVIRSALILL
jgi:hypothetical protein